MKPFEEGRFGLQYSRHADHKTTKQLRSYTRRPGCLSHLNGCNYSVIWKHQLVRNKAKHLYYLNHFFCIQVKYSVRKTVNWCRDSILKGNLTQSSNVLLHNLWPPRVRGSEWNKEQWGFNSKNSFFRLWNCKPDSSGNLNLHLWTLTPSAHS